LKTIDTTAYLSVTQAANELGVNRVFVWSEVRKGNIPALKMSKRKYLISKTDWENYKKSKQTA